MKKILSLGLFLCLLVVTLTSCRVDVKETQRGIVAATKDDMFELKLYFDKDTYSEDDSIQCYATMEYVGEQESITIYHSNPLIGFGLKDNKYFDGGYSSLDELITSTFHKGDVVRFDYMKSGGWDGDDPNVEFYEKFYSEKNLILPANEYEISASISCSLEVEDMMGSKYIQTLMTTISVTP